MATSASLAPAPYRFTRDEYYRMVEAGFFHNKRVELLDGGILTMSLQNSLHAATVYRVAHALEQLIGNTTCVRCQLPIVLNDWSEPESDITVCAPEPNDYGQAHPRPNQVLLLIEVADTNVSFDTVQKAAAYAASGILEL